MSTVNFGKAASKFTDAGIKGKYLLPIAPVGATIGKNAIISDKVLGKAPGRYNSDRDQWSGLGGSYVVTGLTRAEFESFADWPTPNVGVIGRAFPGIDSDAETPAARALVEKSISAAFGAGAFYAERIRGKGHRRLYAFAAIDAEDRDNVVRTRHLTYRLKGEPEDVLHKLDVIGLGGQYLITGTHPSGDEYGWNPKASLEEAEDVRDLLKIDNSDIAQFIEIFITRLEKAGGELVKQSGGKGSGFEAFVKDLKPVMDADTVLKALDELPNNPDTFLHRDDFVSAVSAIRAALGRDSLDRGIEADIREWATQDPEWCDEEYFDKVWTSLEKVRTPQDSLDRLFRRNGIRSHVGENFDNKAKALSKDIEKRKDKVRSETSDLLKQVSKLYIFGRLSVRDGNSQYTMRNRWDVDHELPALAWWKWELAESDPGLLTDLQENERYQANKTGFANFLRDLHAKHPEAFYSDETRHPNYEKGEIYEEEQPDGSIRRSVNMRFISETIREGRKEDKNVKQSKADVKTILEFVNRLFGNMAEYELDTISYMAKTGDRPGSMLFLVGDSGVGKSLYISFLTTIFDGTAPGQTNSIDGAKLHNDSARRFALSQAEGSRIMSIKELPKASSRGASEMANVTSTLKQIVDPGPDADWVLVERKGENVRPVRNHMRVVLSSNYENSIHVEEQDRRIFFVRSQIDLSNKPDEEYYADLAAILRDPKRLAAFWRYLLARDIGDYSRYAPPPVSLAKMERIIADIESPPVRHGTAAMLWLERSDRMLFSVPEFVDLLNDVSEAEHKNLGESGEPPRYTMREGESGRIPQNVLTALKTIKTATAMKIDREIRMKDRARFPAVYVLKRMGEGFKDKLLSMTASEYQIFVEDELDRGIGKHPMELFRL